MIIDPENENKNTNQPLDTNPDEFVDSSFMVSLKGGDGASVSDKIKESSESNNGMTSNEFDDLGDFDFDPSVSAFKPLAKSAVPEPEKKEPEVKPEPKVEAKAEPEAPAFAPSTKAADKTDFEDVAGINDPAFKDGDVDFQEFKGIKEDKNPDDQKLFDAGQNLDFAASTASNSSFANPVEDELELDEEALAINPFAPKNGASMPAAPMRPKDNKVEEPKPSKEENEAAQIQTYGKVSSGVNAFKRDDKKKTDSKKKGKNDKEADKNAAVVPAQGGIIGQANAMNAANGGKPSPFGARGKQNEAPKAAPAPKTQPAAPKAAPAAAKAPVAPAAPKTAPEAPKADAEPAPFAPPAAAKAPVAKAPEQAPSQSIFVGGPAPEPANEPSPFVNNKGNAAPSSNSAKVMQNTRPIPRPNTRPAATERPGGGHAPSHAEHQGANIAPVTQVKKSKRKSKADRPVKEPGKGGIFALIGVLAGIFVLLWVVDNYQTWFGGKEDTVPTQLTAVTTVDAEPAQTEQAETEPASTTTEAAVVETSEATEEESEATQEETQETTAEETEETTEETEEETTTTTTEEETEATTTTSRSSSNNDPVRCSYTITNPRVTSDGFHFDFAITNNGSDLSISRLNEITISFNTSATITSLSSDYFTFTADGDNEFTGTPRSGSLPADETTNITINAVTDESVQHFYISTYHFDWD